MIRYITALTSLLLLVSGLVLAQDRDTKVHNDRKVVQATGLWIYNDLPKGI
ncbi:peptidase, partial [Candidatus Poribacteria bacterium]|nr:peptidase [Candidatus Poribacteria bacterium]